ncbi:hypothetical protein TRVA0_007S03312 [Trichomonascus vanleenenianus]|uniref:uncharacterized protein n=1 Tax=Trichomonascus vanleenenianus TaxID=2268995 RepID=UPI003ECB71D4
MKALLDELLIIVFLYVSEGNHSKDCWLWRTRMVCRDYYRVASSLIWKKVEFHHYQRNSGVAAMRESAYLEFVEDTQEERSADPLYNILRWKLREDKVAEDEFVRDAIRAVIRHNIDERFEVAHNLSEAICCKKERYPTAAAVQLRRSLMRLIGKDAGANNQLLREVVASLRTPFTGKSSVLPQGFYNTTVTPKNARQSLAIIAVNRHRIKELEIRLHQWRDDICHEVSQQLMVGCEFERTYIYFHAMFEERFIQFVEFLRTMRLLRTGQLRIQATLPQSLESFYSTELFAEFNGLNRVNFFDVRVGSREEYPNNPPGLLLGPSLRSFDLKLSQIVYPGWIAEFLQSSPTLSHFGLEVYGIDFSNYDILTLPDNIKHFTMKRHPSLEVEGVTWGIIYGSAVTCLEVLGTATLFYITFQFPKLERLVVDDDKYEFHCVSSPSLDQTCHFIKQLQHLVCYSVSPDLTANILSNCCPSQSLTLQGVKYFSPAGCTRGFLSLSSFQQIAEIKPLPPKVLLDPGAYMNHAKTWTIACFFLNNPCVKRLFLPYEFFKLSPECTFHPLTVEVADRRSTRSFPFGEIYATTFFRANRVLNRRLRRYIISIDHPHRHQAHMPSINLNVPLKHGR